jgi:hypothetical protein
LRCTLRRVIREIPVHTKSESNDEEERRMDKQQSSNTNAWNQNEAANHENQNHEGMAETQEQVSDMYKMGTIEDRGSTR